MALTQIISRTQKYKLGDDGYYKGVVLQPNEKGIIQWILFMRNGDWLYYINENYNCKGGAFPLWSHFPDDNKRSLGELTEEEFKTVSTKLTFLPTDELRQCYEILKGVYNA